MLKTDSTDSTCRLRTQNFHVTTCAGIVIVEFSREICMRAEDIIMQQVPCLVKCQYVFSLLTDNIFSKSKHT